MSSKLIILSILICAFFGMQSINAQDGTIIVMVPCYSDNSTATCYYQNAESPNGTLYPGESAYYFIDFSGIWNETDNTALQVSVVSMSYGSVTLYLNNGDYPESDDDDYDASIEANCSDSNCNEYGFASVCQNEWDWYLEVVNNGDSNVNYELQVLSVYQPDLVCPSVAEESAAWWDMFYLLYVLPFTVLTCCFCCLACCIRRRRCRQRAAYCKINNRTTQDASVSTRVENNSINGQNVQTVTTTYNGAYYPNPPQYYPGNMNTGYFQEAPPPYLFPQQQQQVIPATAPSYQYYSSYQQPQQPQQQVNKKI
jgi:hypothetical protein